MKKTWFTLTFTMIFVLALSVLGANFLVPLLMTKTYSQTACLTDQITSNMDIYDIAKLYRDNRATVAVTVKGTNLSDMQSYTSLGSGVCVASNGYETTSLDANIVANKGSYVVTNYHVIDLVYSNEFVDKTISVLTEDEVTYPCKLLWSDKNLDVAVLYCEENFDYVEMRDRIVNPAEDDALDYEPIFTIGTPLDLSFLNRLTIGEVASNNHMIMPNAEYLYPQDHDRSILGLYNTYEDIIDITVGITNGNSGGGCFDENGVLVGLTTLALNVASTGGNQMNAIVPIYPIIEVIDKLISNNETNSTYSIYTLSKLGITGFDAYEAYYVRAFQQEDRSYPYYYFEGNFYSTISYADEFDFSQDGYYILSNTSTQISSLNKGNILTKCTINGDEIQIIDRNDLIYALLQIDDGDSVMFTYIGAFSLSYNTTIQF